MATTSDGDRLIAIREIRQVTEEKGGSDAEARLITCAYHALDHLADGLKARFQEFEKKSRKYEATVCTQDQTFWEELGRQEMIHHQAITDLTTERDYARELLLKRDEEISRLAHNVGKLEDNLKKARMVIEMKDMEVSACREQECDLRDQL